MELKAKHYLDRLPMTPRGYHKRALPVYGNMAADDPRRGQLNQAFRDMASMVNTVLKASGPLYDVIFEQYFQASMKDAVHKVLTSMVKPSRDASTGADSLGSIAIDGDDFDQEVRRTVGAYTDNRHSGVRMHFRQNDFRNVFKYPQLNNMNCKDFDLFVSWKMLPLAYIVIHELT